MWTLANNEDRQNLAGAVNIDQWWGQIESKILEALIYKDATPEPILATSIAPWIPPSCRGHPVNTEFLKSGQNCASAEPSGCPKTLAELIRKGTYNPLCVQSNSLEELRSVCSLVSITHTQATSKVSVIKY